MTIAIIGGGAAGMITAYLLDKLAHSVTVFEKEATPGGNICTLNKNVTVKGLAPELLLEGGVIEFSNEFRHFRALLEELGVSIEAVEIGTGLFLKNGNALYSKIMIRKNFQGFSRIRENLKYFRMQVLSAGLAIWLRRSNPEANRHRSLGEILPKNNLCHLWLKLFMMYSYSIPWHQIRDFSGEIALFNLRNYMLAGWFRMKGGVYSYIEKILERYGGQLRCGVGISGISRNQDGVSVSLENGENHSFDKVVFATPPHQILRLLADPGVNERKWFSAWKENKVETVIHSDNSLYLPFSIQHPSEFDFFETESGWGYNAILNQVCGIPPGTPYFLSFGLRGHIDPQKIIHLQQHSTPGYTVEAMKYRPEIITANGHNNTFFAGAWLADGLHEGATISAIRVAEILGKA